MNKNEEETLDATTGKSQNIATDVDLLQCCREAACLGPEWSQECEDLDITLLAWGPGKQIAPHVNAEVDVVMIGMEGTGVVTVNGQEHVIRPGVLLLIPKGAERSIQSDADTGRLCYLSLHRRRRRLMPGVIKR